MHCLYERASGLTETIIAAAIDVHRATGPGLLESVYEWCLTKELELRGLSSTTQKDVVIAYKGFVRKNVLYYDILVEGCVIIEVKAVERVLAVHKAQLLSYMKLLDVPIGLLFNFHEQMLISGTSRLILPGANR